MTPLRPRSGAHVAYQIFPERFAIGRPHTSASKLALPVYREVNGVARRWDESPVQGDAQRQFFGGDLQGILDRLDYLQELGVTLVYLTPVFKAPSNHKYDAIDFFTIDPMFGDERTLRRLIEALHERGMRIVLDAVLNHVSDHHPWFKAAQRGEAPYRDYFTFFEDGSYLCWWDHTSMPELNMDNPALQDVLFRRPDSLVQRYLAMGIDGWRFDVANDVGMRFAAQVREVVSARFPDALLVGELLNYGGEWLRDGRGYHGLMNYYQRDAVLEWLKGSIGARQINCTVREYYQGYGHAGATCSWNILATHDTPRLRTTLTTPGALKLAVLAQFTLPGVPLVYYGEENGMEGGHDPDCRRPMVWDEERWDPRIRGWYRKLIVLRQSRPELQDGALTVLGDKLDGEALVFLRHTDVPNQASLVVLNRGDQPFEERVFIPHAHLYNTVPMQNLLAPDQPPPRMQNGSLLVSVPPWSAAIYAPAESYRRFTYYKARNL
jgi:alpha-glucosidase